MPLLVDFLMRLSFGLACGLAATPHSQVTSGYYRNHLYVNLGLASLAALLSSTYSPAAFWWCTLAAVASYFGAVVCLYERVGVGRGVLLVVAALSLGGSLATAKTMAAEPPASTSENEQTATPDPAEAKRAGLSGVASRTTSGLLLGAAMAAMLLGHWYLNTPTMELAPLRRLLVLLAAAVAARAAVSGWGLAREIELFGDPATQWLLFVTLRWSFGIFGVAVLAWMAWQTLKIPNTQSATGILYVAVIGTFVGETMSLLLSAESTFPL